MYTTNHKDKWKQGKNSDKKDAISQIFNRNAKKVFNAFEGQKKYWKKKINQYISKGKERWTRT